MDKIWDSNPSKSEVIGRCGGDETKRITTQNQQKLNAKNHKTNKQTNKQGTYFSESAAKLLCCSMDPLTHSSNILICPSLQYITNKFTFLNLEYSKTS